MGIQQLNILVERYSPWAISVLLSIRSKNQPASPARSFCIMMVAVGTS